MIIADLEQFHDIAHKRGEVFYSKVQPCSAYILGHNPGMGGFTGTIAEHLKQSIDRPDNAYLDESWGRHAPGAHPLQRNIKRIFDAIGMELRDVPASNLIFATSKDSGGVDYGLADVCWSIHLQAMKIIQPRFLLVFGNGEEATPWSYIRSHYPGKEHREPINANAYLKLLDTRIEGRKIRVIAVPHLSYPMYVNQTVEFVRNRSRNFL